MMGTMATAKDIMHLGAECVPESETLDRAAQLMRDKQVGSLPICGTDNKLKGIITDRDIVLKCVAAGRDPSQMRASDLAQGKPLYVELLGQRGRGSLADGEEQDPAGPRAGEPPDRRHDQRGGHRPAPADEKLAHFVSAITSAPPTKVKATGRLKA